MSHGTSVNNIVKYWTVLIVYVIFIMERPFTEKSLSEVIDEKFEEYTEHLCNLSSVLAYPVIDRNTSHANVMSSSFIREVHKSAVMFLQSDIKSTCNEFELKYNALKLERDRENKRDESSFAVASLKYQMNVLNGVTTKMSNVLDASCQTKTECQSKIEEYKRRNSDLMCTIHKLEDEIKLLRKQVVILTNQDDQHTKKITHFTKSNNRRMLTLKMGNFNNSHKLMDVRRQIDALIEGNRSLEQTIADNSRLTEIRDQSDTEYKKYVYNKTCEETIERMVKDEDICIKDQGADIQPETDSDNEEYLNSDNKDTDSNRTVKNSVTAVTQNQETITKKRLLDILNKDTNYENVEENVYSESENMNYKNKKFIETAVHGSKKDIDTVAEIHNEMKSIKE